MRRLDLVVGPNGAGKSTFVAFTLSPLLPRSVFVNADVIARQRWGDEAEAKSYDAARIAADTRAALIARGQSFIAETVFSHPSKLGLIDDAQAAGYVVKLHVMLVPESLTVQRVRYRVAAGGHSVPEHKIRERYQRVWPLAAAAIRRADTATVYDSTSTPSIVAEFVQGMPSGGTRWPAWTPTPLTALSSSRPPDHG